MRKTEILTALLMLLAFSGCSKKKDLGAKAPTRVKTEVVAPVGDVMHGKSYVGVIEEREATAVSFTGMGVVRRVLVCEGQAVSRGQLLAEMDDTQARSLLAAAEAQMAQANDALQRYGLLHDAGSLPEVQWVEIQSKVAQARSTLEVARKNLADCRLVAPVSGIIGRKMIGVGETALPSQAVVTILDISTVKVKVAVPETEMAALTSSTPSVITVEAVGATLTGGQVEKGVVADAMTHTYDVRISVMNSERRLLPGMVASVSLKPTPNPSSGEGSLEPIPDPSSREESGYTLPVKAVQRRADGSLFVWTVDNDSTAHRSAVTIGQPLGNRVLIESGLQQGQRVVTEGYQKLSEGSRVVY